MHAWHHGASFPLLHQSIGGARSIRELLDVMSILPERRQKILD